MHKFWYLLIHNKVLYLMWALSTIIFSFLGILIDFPDKDAIGKQIDTGGIYLISLALVGAFFMNLIDQMRTTYDALKSGNAKEAFIDIKLLLFLLFLLLSWLLIKAYSVPEYKVLAGQLILFFIVFAMGLWVFSLTLYDQTEYSKYCEKIEMEKLKKKQKKLDSTQIKNMKVKL